MNKRLIKMYYKKGIYKEKDLNTFVNARFITEDDKKEIIGGVKSECQSKKLSLDPLPDLRRKNENKSI